MNDKYTFLDLIGFRIHENRPKVPESLKYTIWMEKHKDFSFVQLWFRSRGCRYTHFHGGCTMCDYWISDPISPDLLVDYVKEGLSKLNFDPTILLLNSSGSVFDDWEIPKESRLKIFNVLSELKYARFIFETHPLTISGSKIEECKNILKNNEIEIEIGLESANPLILTYCINKASTINDVTNAIRILKKYGVKSYVNILIGAPFLTLSEVVDDAIYSINWAFEQGADRCVLFPVNIKPWTLVYWLKQQGMYIQPSLWTLTEILSKIRPNLLQRIGISWHKTRPQYHPEYKILNQGATTCSKCHDIVISLLDRYAVSQNRQNIVEELKGLRCDCKLRWFDEYHKTSKLSCLRKRIKANYLIIAEKILGEDWLIEHGDKLESNLSLS